MKKGIRYLALFLLVISQSGMAPMNSLLHLGNNTWRCETRSCQIVSSVMIDGANQTLQVFEKCNDGECVWATMDLEPEFGGYSALFTNGQYDYEFFITVVHANLIQIHMTTQVQEHDMPVYMMPTYYHKE